jgi:hypothetical protein
MNPLLNSLDIEFTPAAAYAAGEVMGGLLTPNPAYGYSGAILHSAMVMDDDNRGAALTCYVFDTPPANIVDTDPFAPSFADLAGFSGSFQVTAGDYETINGNKVAKIDEINMLLPTAAPSYFLVASAAAAFNPNSTIRVRLFLLG